MSNFVPSTEMVEAAAGVFLAMANLQSVEPIVRGYQQKILNEHEWLFAEKYRAQFGRRITCLRNDFMMSESDFARYYALCEHERIKAQLQIKDEGHCPLIDATTMLTNAQNALIEAMFPVTRMSLETLSSAPVGMRQEFIELTLKLLAPFVPADIGLSGKL